MIDFSKDYARLIEADMSHWLESLPAALAQWLKQDIHGELKRWLKLVAQLPQVTTAETQVNLREKVAIGNENQLNSGELARLEGLLKQFMPWRKGPFELFGLHIDTEWRSDWKWDRVVPHIENLVGRKVLDIGCGSGYHLWRMKGEGAALTVGIDPTQLFLAQFYAIKSFMPESIGRDVLYFPLGIEDLQPTQAFDTVFSMGVLYHRRSPLAFIQQCVDQLRSGGQLVLETLVVDGDAQTVFMPGERYAQMRNVWFIPSSAALCHWLERFGLKNIQVVDENITSLEEQRATEWMQTQSLKDFLDPTDISKTCEGYPAPKRAVIIANKK